MSAMKCGHDEKFYNPFDGECCMCQRNTLRSENDRLKKSIYSMEQDTACLPENVSVSEYVSQLRAEVERLTAERDELNKIVNEACQIANSLWSLNQRGQSMILSANISRSRNQDEYSGIDALNQQRKDFEEEISRRLE